MNAAELIAFEKEVAEAIDAGMVPGPTHLTGGNEQQLIDIFRGISPDDYVFCTYRSHFHALLHGVPRDQVMAKIMEGRSMNLAFPAHNFLTSAIVGGMLPIAAGLAAALKRNGSVSKVWCFIGDMGASIGAFHDAAQYALGRNLPITFVIEDNGYATDTPTSACWGMVPQVPLYYKNVVRYEYERTYPHIGTQPRGAL